LRVGAQHPRHLAGHVSHFAQVDGGVH
jgi:hypothetical protein